MYLRENGVTVEHWADPNLAAFKAQVGVPVVANSCHTALVDGYVVEGHVPAKALVSLLETRPNAVGLALPGMPADSPGMGGDAESWDSQPVLLIRHNGLLEPFDY